MQLFPRHIQRAAQDRIEALESKAPPKNPTAASLGFITWCQKHIAIRGVPWSLDGHEYLEEVYQSLADHPYLVFEKAAQVGGSSAVLLSALWRCDESRAKVLYYLSTDQDAYDFSNDRINLTIDDSQYLQDLIEERERGRDNVGLRHIGQGSLFCRGMFTRRKVKAVDGDVLIMDELDEADQNNKEFALDRIMHSSIQHVRELSQPSIPDYGIDETFSRSDQRYWHLKCPTCGKHTCLELALEEQDKRPVPIAFRPVPKNATWAKPNQRYYRACLHCEKPLDMAKGEWVAKHPSQDTIRGYHLSQLYTQIPAVGYADPADKMMEKILSARKTRERLRVSVSIIGFPYGGDRQPVTEAVLDAAEGDRGFQKTAREAYVGVDQGDLLHVVIGQPEGHRIRVVFIAITEDWSDLFSLFKQFNCRAFVGDALPNKNDMKDVCRTINAIRGRKAYIQYFRDTDDINEDEEGKGKRAVPKVTVGRTESLDETTRAIQEGDIILPKMDNLAPEELRLYETFRAQCRMLVKDLEENAQGVMRWVYKKSVPNHFGMALNSMRLARELSPLSLMDRAFEDAPVDEQEWEEMGVLSAGLLDERF